MLDLLYPKRYLPTTYSRYLICVLINIVITKTYMTIAVKEEQTSIPAVKPSKICGGNYHRKHRDVLGI